MLNDVDWMKISELDQNISEHDKTHTSRRRPQSQHARICQEKGLLNDKGKKIPTPGRSREDLAPEKKARVPVLK